MSRTTRKERKKERGIERKTKEALEDTSSEAFVDTETLTTKYRALKSM